MGSVITNQSNKKPTQASELLTYCGQANNQKRSDKLKSKETSCNSIPAVFLEAAPDVWTVRAYPCHQVSVADILVFPSDTNAARRHRIDQAIALLALKKP